MIIGERSECENKKPSEKEEGIKKRWKEDDRRIEQGKIRTAEEKRR